MAEDISPDVIKKTQKILGKYVKKPVLTDKLLKKPPFRFLHDIVISVIKETGFLKGLFSSQELMSENVKEKDAKVAFLNKLIDAVKNVTNVDLAIRASKIVAGLEPTKTNLLLQAIGKAIDDKIDTTAYISQLNSGQIDSTEKKKLKKSTLKKDEKGRTPKTKSKDDSSNKITKAKKINESPRGKTKANTPKDSSRDKNKVDKITKGDAVKNINVIEDEKANNVSNKAAVTEVSTPRESATTSTNIDSIEKANNQNNIPDEHIRVRNQESEREHEKVAENPSANSSKMLDTVHSEIHNKEQENIGNQNSENKEIKSSTQNVVRPKSARPKNENGSGSTITQKNINQDESLKPLQITTNQPPRPKSSLRPPSVRPSSARPGAPRLRPDSALPLQETVTMGNINVIVENVDNMDDEETVVIQTTSEVAEENYNSVEVSKNNKGQLVEQILEQIQEEGESLKKKVDIDWEQDALHNKDGAAKEVNQLRSLIQTLTRTANPLGKLMNYLHEDIEAMHGELQMWTNIKNQLFKEIYKQQRISVESNKPLLTQLEHLQDEITKQQKEIVVVRSNILRNELRIKELLNV